MREQNKQVAIRFIEAMGRNDSEAFAECLAPDAVAVAKGTTNFAGSRSRDMMLGGIEAFKTIFPAGLQLDVISVTADDDRVVVECKGNGTTSGGDKYDNDYCFAITMRDGKVAVVSEYFCTKLADKVLWPLVAGSGGLDRTID